MNFRPTAQLRQWHDDGTCSDLCPHCARIDAYEPPEREPHDLLVTTDYPEPR